MQVDFNFKKKFGQNFLIDNNVIEKIVKESKINKDDIVVEIGPGNGAMSTKLYKKCKHLVLIEIDKELIPILNEKFRDVDNITIIHDDCLKVDYNDLLMKFNCRKLKVVANLPYYITTPIIMKLLEEYNDIIESITIMVQKEVAERMNARCGTKDYGALTLATQFYTNTNLIFDVSPNCFIPKPKVTSSVIKLDIKKISYDKDFIKILFKFIRCGFNQRRKTFLNAMKNVNVNIDICKLSAILLGLNIDLRVRAEKINLEQFIEIVEKYHGK